MASVAIKYGCVTSLDLTGVVEDDDLGGEFLSVGSGVVLGVRGDVTTTDVLHRQVLDVEANVVTGLGLLDLLVVHLHGLNLSGDGHRGEGDDHTGLEDASLDTTDGHCANTANLVDILERKTEGLEDGALWWVKGIKAVKKGGTVVPGHVVGFLNHVVTDPA
jgi:hypothetical protein